VLARNFCLLIPILVYEVKRDISPRRRKPQAASKSIVNYQLNIAFLAQHMSILLAFSRFLTSFYSAIRLI